ncbi:PucR family transcriptional regulator [Neobacillus notoginsengisoli]|uniref:PucR family transcriptional regulator n=1 Tax=Neobacillus notoginsengisoli TaxID=1578198 RepID=A0A417YYI1_9BACI|nr:PucR family transcriptional regulator [Neobacillus notoginsengisoli]RHW42819.1 PucR family transcriptional regulator [Neobacillus notoginsengisoli]
MKVSTALDIGSRFKAEIIAGKKGLIREIKTVEVMEVPEVENWAREGTLVISSFYPVKDDSHQQYHIVKTLIHKNAAGLIVKLGRFVDWIPKEIISLAEKSDFPIIIIPKDVAYIDLLTLINRQLIEEADKIVSDEHNLFYSFKKRVFESTDEAVECLSAIVSNSIYIEDVEGRLLYRSNKFSQDEWRNSLLLFSVPCNENYRGAITEWTKKLDSSINHCIHVPGKRNRFVIPLKMKGKIIAFIHLIYHRKEQFHAIGMNVEMIKGKVYDTIISDFMEFHRQRMAQSEQLERLIVEEADTQNLLIHFKRDLNQVFFSENESFLEHCFLFQKKINDLIMEIAEVQRAVVFEKQFQSYALLCFPRNYAMEKAELKATISSFLNKSSISDTYIAISPLFHNIQEVDQQMNAVTKIMRIGEEISPEERIFTYDRLGIYEFLVKISREPLVQQYVNEIINSLSLHSDQSLLETLEVYLQENGNASRAAEKLFIHRRTMTNRLKRIRELLGMDLDDSENIFILQFCLKIKGLN